MTHGSTVGRQATATAEQGGNGQDHREVSDGRHVEFLSRNGIGEPVEGFLKRDIDCRIP